MAGWSRNSRYFLLSLTAADSAFGLLVMPLNLWVSLLKDYTDGPDALCHVVAFCNATVYSTCMYTLAMISLERYIAVFYPLQYSSLMTRKRTLLLIAFAWCFPPFLLSPISFPDGIIEVHFSTASLVCNPSYSTNVGYSLSLTCFIFFPCSIIMTYANLRVWCAAKRQGLKLRKYGCARRSRHNVASRVLVPVMAAYFTCWIPCMAAMIYNGKQWGGEERRRPDIYTTPLFNSLILPQGSVDDTIPYLSMWTLVEQLDDGWVSFAQIFEPKLSV